MEQTVQGVILTTDEWQQLCDPVLTDVPAGDDQDEQMLTAIIARLTRPNPYPTDWAPIVRALLDAGLTGSSVPPTDLAGKIRQIGEARHAAELTARQLAGEIADLRGRLVTLPGLFESILEDRLNRRFKRYADVSADDACDEACDALTLATQLLDAYELRERDATRPVGWDPAQHQRDAAEQFIPVTPPPEYRRESGWAPADHRRPDEPPTIGGRPVTLINPAVLFLADRLGGAFNPRGCDGTDTCRRTALAQLLLDGYERAYRNSPRAPGVIHPKDDRYIIAAAEILADSTDNLSLATLANRIRDALVHAAVLAQGAEGNGGQYARQRVSWGGTLDPDAPAVSFGETMLLPVGPCSDPTPHSGHSWHEGDFLSPAHWCHGEGTPDSITIEPS